MEEEHFDEIEDDDALENDNEIDDEEEKSESENEEEDDDDNESINAVDGAASNVRSSRPLPDF